MANMIPISTVIVGSGGTTNINSYYDENGERFIYKTPTSTEIQVDEADSLAGYFERSCAKHADKMALHNFGTEISYAQFEEKSRQFASHETTGEETSRGATRHTIGNIVREEGGVGTVGRDCALAEAREGRERVHEGPLGGVLGGVVVAELVDGVAVHLGHVLPVEGLETPRVGLCGLDERAVAVERDDPRGRRRSVHPPEHRTGHLVTGPPAGDA